MQRTTHAQLSLGINANTHTANHTIAKSKLMLLSFIVTLLKVQIKSLLNIHTLDR